MNILLLSRSRIGSRHQVDCLEVKALPTWALGFIQKHKILLTTAYAYEDHFCSGSEEDGSSGKVAVVEADRLMDACLAGVVASRETQGILEGVGGMASEASQATWPVQERVRVWVPGVSALAALLPVQEAPRHPHQGRL